jgi:hypothetical protein
MRILTRIGSDALIRSVALGNFLCILCCLLSQCSAAQGPIPDAPKPFVESSSFVSAAAKELPSQHKFWDKQNLSLFTAAAAIDMADFSVTRANLQSGGRELNPIVRVFGRSTAGLAVNFVGETAGVIGVTYFLHKTGHHRLERLASTVDIGGSAVAVAYGLAHR